MLATEIMISARNGNDSCVLKDIEMMERNFSINAEREIDRRG